MIVIIIINIYNTAVFRITNFANINNKINNVNRVFTNIFID